MRRALAAVVGLAVLVGLALLLASLRGTRTDSYALDVLNSSKDEATIRVSGAQQSWRVPAGGVATFEVTQQPLADDHKEREFTLEAEGQTRTLRSRVDYGRHVVLDVTGEDCIVAADYGAQYRPRDMKLADGMRDITVVKVYRHQQLFLPGAPDPKRVDDLVVKVGLGEKLPDKIEVATRSSRSLHELIRLVRVPCDIVDNDRALYTYLRDH